MDANTLIRPMRILWLCLHLLVAVLLVLVAVRAIVGDAPAAAGVVAAAVIFAVVYAGGSAVPLIRRSGPAAAGWLAVLSVIWLLLLIGTQDGIWLAFPLFLLQMHLVPAGWNVVAVAVTTAAAVTGYALHRGTIDPAMVLGPVIGAGIAVAAVLINRMLYSESEQRRLLIEQLTSTRAELAAAEHASGVLAERERLAREIHDTIAQGLSSIQLLLSAAERDLPVDHATIAAHVAQARRTAQENLAEARRFVRELSPPDLAAGTLPGALRRLCATTSDRSPVATQLHVEGEPVPIATPYEVALLRVAQSALANTTRHARASRAEITLTYMDSGIALDIVDDGVGFDPVAVAEGPAGSDRGFGLAAMQARVADLGGTLTVESAPGQGTAVAVGFDVHPADPIAGPR